MSNTVDRRLGTVTVENARIVFRNFEGKEGQYNREGDRNFALILEDPEVVAQLERDGWNVKYLKPREVDEEPQPYLPVTVNFKGPRPPKVWMITSRGKTQLDESMVMILDWAEFANVDVIVRPYQWAVNGKTGVKAYLQTIFATIQEDELERKYADVPDSALNSIEANAEPLQIGMGEDRIPYSDDEIIIEE